MKAALLFALDRRESYEIASATANLLYEKEISVYAQKPLNDVKVSVCEDVSKILENSDVAIIIGGDGTIIHFAKKAAEYNVPVLGVNNGRLGFLSCAEKSDIHQIYSLLTGKHSISVRMMMDVNVDGKIHHALNDVSISRNAVSQIAKFSLYNSRSKICECFADGVIVATPTGSTAYSLSAGGPVISPDIKCFAVTPVCAHSLCAPSMILGPNESIRAKFLPKSGSEVIVSVDGKAVKSFCSQGKINITRSAFVAKFIIPCQNNFYDNIKKKLFSKFCM